MKHARIAAEVFNRPHMIEPNYGRTFVSALARHGFNIKSLADAEGVTYEAAEVEALSDDYERTSRKLFAEQDGIAIIPVEGTLAHRYGHLDPHSGMTGYDGIQAKLEAAVDDPDVNGIVLDINSPGGAVSGCFDLADQIYEARQQKPIWAVCDELAASAAYALASAATRIVAPRTAQIGSIGVLTMHVDQSQMVADMGLDVTFLFAGDHKVDGNAFEPLPDDVKADIQADIDQVYDMFTALIGRNRAVMSQQQAKDTQARVYGAADAQQVGLIDAVIPTHKVLDTFQRELAPGGPFQSLQRGAKKMALPLFGRTKPNAKAPPDGETDHVAALTAGGFEVESNDEHQVLSLAISGNSEMLDISAFLAAHAEGAINAEQAREVFTAIAQQASGQNLYTESEAREAFAPADTTASLESLVALCGDHACADLAQPLHSRGVSAKAAEQIVADVDTLRSTLVTTFPDEQAAATDIANRFALAAHGTTTPQFAKPIAALMVEAQALMSGEEIDHHPPADFAQTGGAGSFNAVKFYDRK